jgi:hypothetical protein
MPCGYGSCARDGKQIEADPAHHLGKHALHLTMASSEPPAKRALSSWQWWLLADGALFGALTAVLARGSWRTRLALRQLPVVATAVRSQQAD